MQIIIQRKRSGFQRVPTIPCTIERCKTCPAICKKVRHAPA